MMEVNPSNVCNMSCKWCFCGHSKDQIPIVPFKEYVDDYVDMGGKSLTFSGGGEPTVWPHFEEATHYCKGAGLDLGLMTNGTFSNASLVDENYNWVRISLDTVRDHEYQQWKRSKKLPVVLQNIEKIHKTKLGINVNVGEWHTIGSVVDLIARVEEHCDYIQFRPILFGKSAVNDEVWNWLKSQSDHPKLLFSMDKLEDFDGEIPFRYCEGHCFCPILDADGTVRVCMYHAGNPLFSFGNIKEKRFRQIWKDRLPLIEKWKKEWCLSNCPRCCKLWEINKLLHLIREVDEDEDKHFI